MDVFQNWANTLKLTMFGTHLSSSPSILKCNSTSYVQIQAHQCVGACLRLSALSALVCIGVFV